MATIKENKRLWESQYEWSEAGDEWSSPWGGTRNLWEYVIYPRIQSYLPANFLVEIAPGFGRWTQFLQQHCGRLLAVDVSSKCVDHSQQRFAAVPNVSVVQNDGKTIPVTESGSVDFVFSFDSLVHVEADTLQAYMREIARVLRPGGAAFIHHSNLGSYKPLLRFVRRLPGVATKVARKANLLPVEHWRAESVTASWLASVCRQYGLSVVSQELINWRNQGHLIDCLSTIENTPGKAVKIRKNSNFMAEAEQIRLMHSKS